MENFEDDIKEEDEDSYPSGDETQNQPDENYIHKLKKSGYNKIILGVCGGLGEYFSIEPVFFRMLFLFGLLIGGWGVIIYLIAALLMPGDTSPKEIDEEEIERIKKSNNISLIAGIILLAGMYIVLDDFGYFSFLSAIGIPSDYIIILIVCVVLFFIFSFWTGKKEEVVQPDRFVRNKNNALFGGICSGFADYIGVSASSIRLAAVLLSFLTLGIPVLIYLFFLSQIPAGDKI